MSGERGVRGRVKAAPSFEEILDVMSAASAGDAAARVRIPEDAELDHLPTRFGVALNALLDELEQRSEVRLRRLIDSVQDYAIFLLDPDGLVTTWSAGAKRLYGYDEAEILGRSATIFLEPEAVVRASEQLRLACTLGHVEDEGPRLRKDGSRFWGNVVITALKDAEGRNIGFAKITRDLTERRRTEEALRLANRELEAFSYSVAHDLRGPLRGMNGFAHFLLDDYGDKLDAQGQRWLRSIVGNAEKMAELIDGLLSLSRVARVDPKRARVDLSAVTREVAESLRAQDPARQTEVVVAEALEADADPRLLRALLENLLGNAWKFTSTVTGARIEVGTATEEGAPAFFVRDNGVGFDMAFASKLFGPFQRLHSKEQFPGHGIGLATAQRIVERHGGRIWAVSAPGAGTTVYFTLPAPVAEK